METIENYINMNNKKVKFYIIAGTIFIVCAFMGFTIVHIIKHYKPNNQTEISTDSLGLNRESSQSENPKEVLEKGKDSVEVIPEGKPSPQEIRPMERQTSIQQISTPDQEQKPSHRVTEEQLTSIINNLQNPNYPRNVKLHYTNLDKENGEECLTSIPLIRQYIKTGIWKRVTVTHAGYDEKNNVTSITMTIIR